MLHPKIQYGRYIPRQFHIHSVSCKTRREAEALRRRLCEAGARVFGAMQHIYIQRRRASGQIRTYEYFRVAYMTPETTRAYGRWLASPASSLWSAGAVSEDVPHGRAAHRP